MNKNLTTAALLACLLVLGVSSFVPSAQALEPGECDPDLGPCQQNTGGGTQTTTGNATPVTQTTSGNPTQPTQTTTGNPTPSKPDGTEVRLINPLGTTGQNGLQQFLSNILDFVIRIGTVVVVLMMVFVGFKFVTAQGEPGEISKARDMLLWTVVGALILLGARVIAAGIEATVKALSIGS